MQVRLRRVLPALAVTIALIGGVTTPSDAATSAAPVAQQEQFTKTDATPVVDSALVTDTQVAVDTSNAARFETASAKCEYSAFYSASYSYKYNGKKRSLGTLIVSDDGCDHYRAAFLFSKAIQKGKVYFKSKLKLRNRMTGKSDSDSGYFKHYVGPVTVKGNFCEINGSGSIVVATSKKSHKTVKLYPEVAFASCN